MMMVFFSAILSKRRNFKQKIWVVYLARMQRLIESNNISENIFQLKLIYMRLAKLMTFHFRTSFAKVSGKRNGRYYSSDSALVKFGAIGAKTIHLKFTFSNLTFRIVFEKSHPLSFLLLTPSRMVMSNLLKMLYLCFILLRTDVKGQF